MKKLLQVKLLIFLLLTPLFAKDKFIELSLGIAHVPYSKKDSVGVIEIKPLDESAYIYNLALGTEVSENIFTTLNYQRTNLNDMHIDDFYLTLNYKFNHKLNPYIGALLGKSYITWDKDPLNSSTIRNYTSDSFLYGLQAGLEYPVSEYFSFLPKFSYFRTNHGTSLISLPALSHIEHNERFNFLLGFRYRF